MSGLSLIGPAYFLALDREAPETAFTHRCHLANFRVLSAGLASSLIVVSIYHVMIRGFASMACARARWLFDQIDQAIGITHEEATLRCRSRSR